MLNAKTLAALRPGRHRDNDGLYLEFKATGKRSWIFRYEFHGKERWMGLGPYPLVGLAKARKFHQAARLQLLAGIDPLAAKLTEKAEHAAEAARTVTFRQAALDFLKSPRVSQLKNAKHRAQWRSTLESYAFPVFGSLPLRQIDEAMVLKALKPVAERAPETASRLRGRIERVFEWARPIKLFDGDNPARREVLQDHLPSRGKVEHHAALHYNDLPAFFAELAARDGTAARALEFLVLTASRTGEVTGALWSEVDLKAKCWTVPANRIKGGKEHRVPLSDQAVEVLEKLPRLGEHVFVNGGGLPLSNMAMATVLKRMKRKGVTVHGFRSTFRDWAAERTAYPNHVVEMALAHTIGSKVEAAYRRGDLLDKRAKLMSDWGRYATTPHAEGENVVPLQGRAKKA